MGRVPQVKAHLVGDFDMDSPEPVIGVYCIENKANGDRYVGESCNMRHRIDLHLSQLRHGQNPNAILQAGCNEHGMEAITWRVLELLPPNMRCVQWGWLLGKWLQQREAVWVLKLNANCNSRRGYHLIFHQGIYRSYRHLKRRWRRYWQMLEKCSDIGHCHHWIASMFSGRKNRRLVDGRWHWNCCPGA